MKDKNERMNEELKVKLRALKLISRSGDDMREASLDERFYAPGVVFEATEAQAKKLLRARNVRWSEESGANGTSFVRNEEKVAEKVPPSTKLTSQDDCAQMYREYTKKLARETAEKIKADVARSR